MRSTNVRSTIVLFVVAIFLLVTLSSVHALPTSDITSRLNPLNKHHDKKEATDVAQDQVKKSHDQDEKTQVQKQKVTIHNNDGGAAPSADNGHTKKKSTKSPTSVSKIGSPCPPAMRPSGNICVPYHPFFKPNQ